MPALSSDSVFINCPFDEAYKPLLHAIIFCVIRCGFVPRSAQETDDASDLRIEKIARLIADCKYGIHDISRTEQDAATGLPRFNMPFELGVFWGCKKFGTGQNKKKVALVFEKESYSYLKYLSDLNGVDPKAHANKPGLVIKAIRNWLHTNSGRSTIPTAHTVQENYKTFTEHTLPLMLKESNTTLNDLTFNDYCTYVATTLNMQINP